MASGVCVLVCVRLAAFLDVFDPLIVDCGLSSAQNPVVLCETVCHSIM